MAVKLESYVVDVKQLTNTTCDDLIVFLQMDIFRWPLPMLVRKMFLIFNPLQTVIISNFKYSFSRKYTLLHLIKAYFGEHLESRKENINCAFYIFSHFKNVQLISIEVIFPNFYEMTITIPYFLLLSLQSLWYKKHIYCY